MRINRTTQRTMQVFEAFDIMRRPLALNEIATELKIPPSSGIVLLKTLVRTGYLEFDRKSRTYLPTMRIAILSDWVPDTLYVRSRILPVMQSLAEKTGETVVIGTQSDLYAQYIHVVVRKEASYWSLLPGTLRPLSTSGIGMLLLSTLSSNDLEQTLRRFKAASDSKDPALGLESIQERLKQIRDQGYVFNRNLVRSDMGIIAVILKASFFDRTLVLGIGGTWHDLEANLDRYLTMLRRSALEVEEEASQNSDTCMLQDLESYLSDLTV